MRKFLNIIGITMLLVVVGGAIVWFGFLKPSPPPISELDRSRLNVMPLPAEVRLEEGDLDVSGGFKIDMSTLPFLKDKNADGPNSLIQSWNDPYLYNSLNRFTDLSSSTSQGSEIPLNIDCTECGNTDIVFPVNESYELKITSNGVTIKADNRTGIIRGSETLSQLIYWNENQYFIPKGTIKDSPRYSWRGLMVDVCRHWIDKPTMLRILDGMAAAKLNVLHWHLSEYQAFRIESKVFPKLHELGSNGLYYSQEEVKEIIKYATDRGIRVVPEFDVPGHSTSWFVGYPELASAPGPYALDKIYGILDPVMDPTSEEVYDFLDRFFAEMAGLFPDEYIHIGGDEVKMRQWDENEAIQSFMKDYNIKDNHALQAYFNIRLQKILSNHGKKMAGWDEIIHPDLPKDGIAVQAWRNQISLWDAARSGNKALLSSGYYLDHKRPASFHYGVDPEIIEGAVTIDIDKENWKSWDIELYVQGNEMPGKLYLFGEGEEQNGVLEMMGTPTSFENAKVVDNTLIFENDTDYGIVKHEHRIVGDSLIGSASLSFINIDVKGIRNGGTDIPNGKQLPEFKKIEPLTEAQAANILGGEACMWTEMTDNVTSESRIFPRAAVVAEKLWSPKEVTTDVKDMYRRLIHFDNYLEENGLRHRTYRSALLGSIIQGPELEILEGVVDILSEDLMFNRMKIYEGGLTVDIPLNRIVDAAPAESLDAYQFGQDVDLWLDEADTEAKLRIIEKLNKWAQSLIELGPVIEKDERLTAIAPHISNLSILSQVALESMDKPDGARPSNSEFSALILQAKEAHEATNLAVADHLERLINANSELK